MTPADRRNNRIVPHDTAMVGRRFGRLVIHEAAPGKGVRYRCRCDCGRPRIVNQAALCRRTNPIVQCLYCEYPVQVGRDFWEPDLPGEAWLPIAEVEGAYVVSDAGRVARVWDDHLGRPRRRVVKPTESTRGHLKIGLNFGGKRLQRGLARIVAITFAGPPPSLELLVIHRDGNKINCRVENLAWAAPEDC